MRWMHDEQFIELLVGELKGHVLYLNLSKSITFACRKKMSKVNTFILLWTKSILASAAKYCNYTTKTLM